ncbi:MAG: hypothetical protein ACQESG_00845 [Nanobdellota archaeon]
MVDIDIELDKQPRMAGLKNRFGQFKRPKAGHYLVGAALLALPFIPFCNGNEQRLDTTKVESYVSRSVAEGELKGYESHEVSFNASRWAWYLEDTILRDDLSQFNRINDFLDVNLLYLGFIHKDPAKNDNDYCRASEYLNQHPDRVRDFLDSTGLEGMVAVSTDFDQTKNPVLDKPNIGKRIMDDIAEFNNSGDPGLRGIIFNAELYSHVEGDEAREQNRALLGLMKEYHAYGSERDLIVSFTVDSWWNQVLEFEGKEKEFYKHAMDILDRIDVTAYRSFAEGDIHGPEDGIIDRLKPFFAYASHADCHLVAGFETSDFSQQAFKEMYPYKESRDRVSFNVPGKDYDDCHRELQKAFGVLDRPGVSFSVAYHGIGSDDFIQQSDLYKQWRKTQ